MKPSIAGILVCLNLFVQTAWAQPADPPLSFHVTGFDSNIGQALLELFRSDDKVPQKPFMLIKTAIVDKAASFTIPNLPHGDYAAIVVHDQNANNEIDHSWGLPSEPLGFTNNWKLRLFSGMPSFEKLKFTYSNANNVVNVKMDQ